MLVFSTNMSKPGMKVKGKEILLRLNCQMKYLLISNSKDAITG